MDEFYKGKTIVVTATVTGIGEGACRGQQVQAKQSIRFTTPPECPNHSCSRATRFLLLSH